MSLLTAFSSDALFTAPFRALLCYQRRLTLVGTEAVSTSDSFECSSYPLTWRTNIPKGQWFYRRGSTRPAHCQPVSLEGLHCLSRSPHQLGSLGLRTVWAWYISQR